MMIALLVTAHAVAAPFRNRPTEHGKVGAVDPSSNDPARRESANLTEHRAERLTLLRLVSR